MTSREELIGFARKALGLSESVLLRLTPLPGRGSDRSFFRLTWNRADSAILVHYDPKRVENTYYAGIALFLRKIHVAVPKLIRHDPALCLILMEDMGDRDLWFFRKSPWQTRRDLYQKTLTIIHKLHSLSEKDFPSERVRLMEGFDSSLYRWERDYFKDHFVWGVCGIKLEPPFEQKLEAELSALAERLAGTRQSLVHRDLQSQNVMVRDGKPFLIDFQGMRIGCPFYDLGSLLNDPYVDFSVKEREEFLSFYSGLSKQHLDWVTFQTYFWEASAQRLMQALGAYGFLGLKKGLRTFLDHIPAGLRNLQLAAAHTPSLPRLLELSNACRGSIEQNNLTIHG